MRSDRRGTGGVKAAVHWVRVEIAPNRLIAEFNISGYRVARVLSASSARQRLSAY